MPERPPDFEIPPDRNDPPCEECRCNGRGFLMADDAMPGKGYENLGIALTCYCECHDKRPDTVH